MLRSWSSPCQTLTQVRVPLRIVEHFSVESGGRQETFELHAMVDVDAGSWAEIVKSCHQFRVQVREFLRCAAPGRVPVRSRSDKFIEVFRVDECEGYVVVGECGALGRLFDGARHLRRMASTCSVCAHSWLLAGAGGCVRLLRR